MLIINKKATAAIIAVILSLLIIISLAFFENEADDNLVTTTEVSTTVCPTTAESTTEPKTTEVTTTKKYISTTKEATETTVASLKSTQKPTTTKTLLKTKKHYTEQDIITLAKVLYRECRGVKSDTEKACVAWVACNRVDAGFGGTITSVLTQRNQFAYYYNTPVNSNLYNLAADVLKRWDREKSGEKNVGRVLPKDYLYFYGDGSHNHFRKTYKGTSLWNYSLSSPYSS